MATAADRHISRADIEAKLREIKGDVDTTVQTAKPIAMTVVTVAAVAVIAIAYALGRRRGKKRSTIVEVRRV
jgi:hypothetical protein